MRTLSVLGVIVLALCVFSCKLNKKAEETPKVEPGKYDEYIGQTIVEEWGQGPGFDAFAGFVLSGAKTVDETFVLFTYVNENQDYLIIMTDHDRRVADMMEFALSGVEGNQYLSSSVLENFVPENWNPADGINVDPYYIAVFQVDNQEDFIDRQFFDQVVKAWKFNPATHKYEEVADIDGLHVYNEGYGV